MKIYWRDEGVGLLLARLAWRHQSSCVARRRQPGVQNWRGEARSLYGRGDDCSQGLCCGCQSIFAAPCLAALPCLVADFAPRRGPYDAPSNFGHRRCITLLQTPRKYVLRAPIPNVFPHTLWSAPSPCRCWGCLPGICPVHGGTVSQLEPTPPGSPCKHSMHLLHGPLCTYNAPVGT